MSDLIKTLMRRLGNHDTIELSRHEMFQIAKGIETDFSAKMAISDYLISYIENGNKYLLEQNNKTLNSLYLKLTNCELADYELTQLIIEILETQKNEKSFYW